MVSSTVAQQTIVATPPAPLLAIGPMRSAAALTTMTGEPIQVALRHLEPVHLVGNLEHLETNTCT